MGTKPKTHIHSRKLSKRKGNNPVALKRPGQLVNIPLPKAEEDSEFEDNISEQDIEFVKEHSQRLSFLEKIEQDELDQQVLEKQEADIKALDKKLVAKTRQEVEEDEQSDDEEVDELDQEHEKQQSPVDNKELKKEKPSQLPIKTVDGKIVLKEEMNSEAADLARRVEGVTVDDAFIEDAEPEDDEKSEQQELLENASETNSNIEYEDPDQEVAMVQEDMKTTIALCANEMLVRGEKSVTPLRKLLSLCRNEDSQICNFALLSCMKVFLDIIPGYKIQAKTTSMSAQTKKKSEREELKRKEYEALLLRCYQSYLKILLERSKSIEITPQSLRICIKCFCGLAQSLYHFNYGTDLIKSIVGWMKSPDSIIREECCNCAEEIIKTDLDGNRALEVVQLVGDLIRKQKCCCDPIIVQCLLCLTFSDIRLPTKEERKIKKTSKNKRKKMFKIRDELEKQGQEYDVHQLPFDKSLQKKSEIQTQTVEVLFEIFFRVLKHCSHQTHSRSCHENDYAVHAFIQKKCPLLLVCLQGLEKYAHVMSVEYFEDLLQVMTKLLSCESLPFHERFQCLYTVSCILKGQGEALNIDRRDFYQQLYWSLCHWKPDSIQDTILSSHRIPTTEDTLLIQVCNQMLCDTKTSDFGRLAAFMKRLLAISLHQETGITMGITAIINKLLLKYRRLRALMNGESEISLAGGIYDSSVMDPSQAGGLLTSLWEFTLLKRHFNPHTSQGAQQLMKIQPDAINNLQTLVNGILTSTLGPSGVAEKYSTKDGTFWPFPKLPATKKRKTPCSDSPLPAEFSTILHEEKHNDNNLEFSLKKHFKSQRKHEALVRSVKEKERLKLKLDLFKNHLA